MLWYETLIFSNYDGILGSLILDTKKRIPSTTPFRCAKPKSQRHREAPPAIQPLPSGDPNCFVFPRSLGLNFG